MWGSTSVACCPGPTVYGSELICVRFAPTGFPGCSTVEEDPEQPTRASVHNPSRETATALIRKKSTLVSIIQESVCSKKARFERCGSIIGGTTANVNY